MVVPDIRFFDVDVLGVPISVYLGKGEINLSVGVTESNIFIASLASMVGLLVPAVLLIEGGDDCAAFFPGGYCYCGSAIMVVPRWSTRASSMLS